MSEKKEDRIPNDNKKSEEDTKNNNSEIEYRRKMVKIM